MSGSKRLGGFGAAAGTLLLASLMLAGAAGAGASVPGQPHRRTAPVRHTPTPPTPLPPVTLSKPAVPTSGSYLGVDANFDPAVAPYQQLVSLQGSVGRRMAVAAVYLSFTAKVPLSLLDDIAAQHSIPLVSWHCGGTDAAVASGADDTTIRAEADALKTFGRPVFLRWFWEMNLANVAAYAACLGTGQTAAEYVAAYRHIVAIFRQAGAGNVAFVWAPSASVHAPSATAFYPGASYVDWIGFDLYNRPDNPQGFAPSFAPSYAAYAGYGKPMAITETGAPAGASGPGGGSPTQAQWLQQIATSLPGSFPKVHALVYVDAKDLANYTLQGAGLTAFASLGAARYFSPMG